MSLRFPNIRGLPRASRDHTSAGPGLWNRVCAQSAFSSSSGTRIIAYGEWGRRGIEDGIHVVHWSKWIEKNPRSRAVPCWRAASASGGLHFRQSPSQGYVCLAARNWNPTTASSLSEDCSSQVTRSPKKAAWFLCGYLRRSSRNQHPAGPLLHRPHLWLSRRYLGSYTDKHFSWLPSRKKAR